MNFSEAYKLMVQGQKIRRPGWTGYWYLNGDDIVVIHCKSGIDIKNYYNEETIPNCAKNDWEVVKCDAEE